MLDFGCGTGAFSARWLEAERLSVGTLALVEPVRAHLEAAERRLAAHVGEILVLDPALNALGTRRFDLIIANHSLYYVPDLDATARGLVAARAPGGTLVVALLDERNLLAALWRAGFAAMGRPFPFALAGDWEAALARLDVASDREWVRYRIDVPDSTSARTRMSRFLFGAEVVDAHGERLLALFDDYRAGARIVIETAYPHLVAGVTDHRDREGTTSR
ncbi:MAG: class I SAM-dependent methyltransferase [Pseudomonadota bacterium]